MAVAVAVAVAMVVVVAVVGTMVAVTRLARETVKKRVDLNLDSLILFALKP